MPLSRIWRTFATLMLLTLVASALTLQSRDKIPDHEFERETVVDDAGLKQWAPWDMTCPQCKGVKEIPCYVCGDTAREHCIICGGDQKSVCSMCTGTARVPDPVVEVACPFCRGIGVYPCAQCWGAGSFPVNQADGSVKDEKCRGCKELGGFDCLPCGGTRRLASPTVKKKLLAEAAIKDRKAVRASLAKLLASLETFEHGSSARKTEKALGQLFKKYAKVFPVSKDMLELFAVVHKAFSKSASGYQGYDDNLARQFYIFQDRTTWLLRHQIFLLDVEIARAEFNESVLAESK